MLLTVGMTATAQSRGEKYRAFLDSVLTSRYFKNSYDSNYVVRPEGRLTLKIRLNQTGNSLHAKGTVNGVYSKADLHTSHKTTVALAATYRGLSAGLAINPAKIGGVYKDYEFNFNYYSTNSYILIRHNKIIVIELYDLGNEELYYLIKKYPYKYFFISKDINIINELKNYYFADLGIIIDNYEESIINRNHNKNTFLLNVN